MIWHDLPYQGPFDLSASTRFLEGFAPASRPDAAAVAGELRLAFPAAPSWRPVGVLVRQSEPGGPVRARVFGDPADVEPTLGHVRRILSLDVDGAGFASVGARDPVVASLRERYPGLRPVAFHSPYEAACWAIIGHRIRITQASAIKQRLAERLGAEVDVAGVRLATFPAPGALPERIPLVSELKSDRLHAVAEAALADRLDATALRTQPDALSRLRELPGIGPFSAELILLRGAGEPDGFPTAESRLHDEMARAYELDEPRPAELAEIAEGWRPYRTWVSLLLRARREDETGEIATGRGGGGLARVHQEPLGRGGGGPRGDALELFVRLAGSSDEDIEGPRSAPVWPALERLAPTLAYDAACLGDGPPPPRLATITQPVLVLTGDAGLPGMASDFFTRAAAAIGEYLPHARHRPSRARVT